LGSAGLRYEHPDDSFYGEVFVRFAGDQDRLHPGDESDLRICENPETLGDTYGDGDLDCPGTLGWVTLNVRGGYRLDDTLRADLSVENLTDELYHYHGSGIDAPGVGATISVAGGF
jgi:outer membrane receptor protein involved in Fe transport